MDSEAKAQTELEDFKDIFSLDGKVAVVTGGSRGLGLHAASGLLQAGCSKVYITSRKASACDSACAALNALPNKRPGAKAISVPADSAKIAGVEALVKEVQKTTDHVDILFANAGATWGERFDTHPDSAFTKVMDLNVKSVFNTIRLYVGSNTSLDRRGCLLGCIGTDAVIGLRPFCRKRHQRKTHHES
ncbi:MAG: hypothetical protein LQ341_006371 [Variospora aurantia]|nr:MAG: hypothetical protein LQ341_006371 [Variospora aurantia]